MNLYDFQDYLPFILRLFGISTHSFSPQLLSVKSESGSPCPTGQLNVYIFALCQIQIGWESISTSVSDI